MKNPPDAADDEDDDPVVENSNNENEDLHHHQPMMEMTQDDNMIIEWEEEQPIDLRRTSSSKQQPHGQVITKPLQQQQYHPSIKGKKTEAEIDGIFKWLEDDDVDDENEQEHSSAVKKKKKKNHRNPPSHILTTTEASESSIQTNDDDENQEVPTPRQGNLLLKQQESSSRTETASSKQHRQRGRSPTARSSSTAPPLSKRGPSTSLAARQRRRQRKGGGKENDNDDSPSLTTGNNNPSSFQSPVPPPSSSTMPENSERNQKQAKNKESSSFEDGGGGGQESLQALLRQLSTPQSVPPPAHTSSSSFSSTGRLTSCSDSSSRHRHRQSHPPLPAADLHTQEAEAEQGDSLGIVRRLHQSPPPPSLPSVSDDTTPPLSSSQAGSGAVVSGGVSQPSHPPQAHAPKHKGFLSSSSSTGRMPPPTEAASSSTSSSSQPLSKQRYGKIPRLAPVGATSMPPPPLPKMMMIQAKVGVPSVLPDDPAKRRLPAETKSNEKETTVVKSQPQEDDDEFGSLDYLDFDFDAMVQGVTTKETSNSNRSSIQETAMVLPASSATTTSNESRKGSSTTSSSSCESKTNDDKARASSVAPATTSSDTNPKGSSSTDTSHEVADGIDWGNADFDDIDQMMAAVEAKAKAPPQQNENMPAASTANHSVMIPTTKTSITTAPATSTTANPPPSNSAALVDEFGDMDFDFDVLDEMVAQQSQSSSLQAHQQQARPPLHSSDLTTKPMIAQHRSPADDIVNNPQVETPLSPPGVEYPTFTRYKIAAIQEGTRCSEQQKTLSLVAWNERMIQHETQFSIHHSDKLPPLSATDNPLAISTAYLKDEAIVGDLHLRGEWYYMDIEVGSTIHLCSLSGRFRTDPDALPITLHGTPPQGSVHDDLVMILHPDLLVTPTLVGEGTGCARRAVLKSRLGSTGLSSKAALIGTMRHDLLGACLLEKELTQSIMFRIVQRIVRENAEGLLACKMSSREAEKSLMDMRAMIQEFIRDYTSLSVPQRAENPQAVLPGNRIDSDVRFVATGVSSIEEPVVSPELALKGNMDAILEATTISVGSSQKSEPVLMSMELKTGHNQNAQNAHMAQLSLYVLMLHSRHGVASENGSKSDSSESKGPLAARGGLLLYMNDKGLQTVHVASFVQELKSLLGTRNLVAANLEKANRPRGVIVQFEGDSGSLVQKPK